MNHLIQQGKILYWGTSEWSAQEIMEAHMVAEKYRLIGPTMEQPEYSMFHREKMENEYLQIFRNVGLGTTIWSPLAAGVLTGKYNEGIPEDSRLAIKGFEWLVTKQLNEQRIEKVRRLTTIANELGCSMASLAIAWCAYNTNVSTVILGATKASQLTENLKALEVLPLLSKAVMEKIDGVLQNKPVLPEW
jgi:aryl-alcohol dehydrogenase-like predicted oxidoreductase